MKDWILQAVLGREEENIEGQFETKDARCGQKRKMQEIEKTIVPTHRVYLHRQTTERVAIGPEEWELIPVGHNMPPAVILENIARVYRDIGDQWSALTWWLCRIHESSVLSAMPILGYANYVLVLENEYVNLGRRPHGLMELVCGDDSYLFPTVLPEWLNWPLLQAFLEPISHCNHFGMGTMGFYNGDRLSQRLVQCNSGFFVQVHYC